MEPNPFLGVLMYVLGGLAGASFYLPFKKVRSWAWESFWMVYSVVALLAVPWILAYVLSPNVLGVVKEVPWEKLRQCYLFGAMWGVGGLTWGLMIRYLGVGLGLAIGCGACAAFGTLVPPIIDDKFGELISTNHGIATLVGIVVSLVGIVVTGAAGMSKERELSEAEKKSSVAEFNFPKGICVAIFSGIMSAGMAFGLATAEKFIDPLTQKVEPHTPIAWQGLPGLAVILLGGFTVNCLWCIFLHLKNRTGCDYCKREAPRVRNVILSSLAGAIWYVQFVFFTIGATKIGEYKFSGWTLLMSSQIIFSTLWGIALLEWKGTSRRTRKLMAAGLAILVLSLVVIGYGNYLKPPATK